MSNSCSGSDSVNSVTRTEYGLVRCDSFQSDRQLSTFRRNLMPPSAESTISPSYAFRQRHNKMTFPHFTFICSSLTVVPKSYRDQKHIFSFCQLKSMNNYLTDYRNAGMCFSHWPIRDTPCLAWTVLRMCGVLLPLSLYTFIPLLCVAQMQGRIFICLHKSAACDISLR